MIGERPAWRRRAVVMGGGFGGLLAAAALAGVVDEVTVLERDHFPDGPVPRRGVPQSSQLHNLLHSAHHLTESLVPGFTEALVAAGAVQASVAADTYVHELGRRMPRRDLGLQIMSAPRPVIDHVLRELVASQSNVNIVEAATVTELDLADGQLRGVSARTRSGEAVHYESELVVDALGPNSPCTRQLESAQIHVPVEHRAVAQWYSTCEFELPALAADVPPFMLIFPDPASTRAGLLSPAPAGGVSASVSGTADDPPPTDIPSFLDYAASLDDPALAEVLARCTPRTEPTMFRRMQAIWRHYEVSQNPVAGLLPIGDAVAELNPLQGQGMSVAATQAVALASAVGETDRLDEVTRSYLGAASEPIRRAWDLAAIAGPTGRERLPWPYLKALGARFNDDAELHRLYLRVWHLLEPVQTLETEDVRQRVLAGQP